MNEHSTEISVPARHEALVELTETIGHACKSMAVSDADCLRLQLLAEELFINTIEHGFSGASGTNIRLVVSLNADGLTLRYEDEAPAFDPFTASPPLASEDAVGGLGLTLLRGMSRTRHYRREAGRNIIEIGLQAP